MDADECVLPGPLLIHSFCPVAVGSSGAHWQPSCSFVISEKDYLCWDKVIAEEVKQWCRHQSHTCPLEFDFLTTTAHSEEMLENKKSSFCMQWQPFRLPIWECKHTSLQNDVCQKAQPPANNREDVIVQSDMMTWIECVKAAPSRLVIMSTTGWHLTVSAVYTEMKTYTLQRTKGTEQRLPWWRIRSAYVSYLV